MPDNIEMEIELVDTPEIALEVEVGDSISAATAEAYATGKRNGQDVTEGDPTYHNNAKYYAQQSAGAVSASDDAARAAAEAKAYALGSNQSWTNSAGLTTIINPGTTNWIGADGKDKTLKTGSKTFAEQAADEARFAEAQKAAAAQSATGAAQSATDANSSATAAAQSATDAEASKTDAAGILEQVQQIQAGIPADYTTLDRLQQLQAENIPGTVQKYEFSGGNVQKVTHQQGETAVRTDVFAYSGETITETRTLATGEKLEIETNLSTLETTTAYTAA